MSWAPRMGANLLHQVTGVTFVLSTVTTLHGSGTMTVFGRNCGHTSAFAALTPIWGVIAGIVHLWYAHSQT
jgi:hypothetical protein